MQFSADCRLRALPDSCSWTRRVSEYSPIIRGRRRGKKRESRRDHLDTRCSRNWRESLSFFPKRNRHEGTDETDEQREEEGGKNPNSRFASQLHACAF